MSESQSIPAAVGAYVARVRQEHGLTLDQIAQTARVYGARWSASSVGNIERGQSSLTITNMLLLALSLGSLTGRPLKLADLLGGAEALDLTPGSSSSLKRDWFDAMLGGAKVRVSIEDFDWFDSGDEPSEEDLAVSEMSGREMTPAEKDAQFRQLVDQSQMPPEPYSRSRPTGSLVEERAANKLGISLSRLQSCSNVLWGRSLEEESHRRAGPGSTPQARGRVTRILVDELRESIR